MVKDFREGAGGSESYGSRFVETSNREFDNDVDPEAEGVEEMILNFRTKLQSSDLEEQTDLDILHAMIAEIAETDNEQAESLKQEMLDRKIE